MVQLNISILNKSLINVVLSVLKKKKEGKKTSPFPKFLKHLYKRK